MASILHNLNTILHFEELGSELDLVYHFIHRKHHQQASRLVQIWHKQAKILPKFSHLLQHLQIIVTYIFGIFHQQVFRVKLYLQIHPVIVEQ